MEDVTMTIKPVFDMDEDEEYDSDNSSEHGITMTTKLSLLGYHCNNFLVAMATIT